MSVLRTLRKRRKAQAKKRSARRTRAVEKSTAKAVTALYSAIGDCGVSGGPEVAREPNSQSLPSLFAPEGKHCDDYIGDENQPQCLRRFLRWKRWPALYQCRAKSLGFKTPQLFACYKGKRVKVNMASRFGDVGITYDLSLENGYDNRVNVEDLGDFSDNLGG